MILARLQLLLGLCCVVVEDGALHWSRHNRNAGENERERQTRSFDSVKNRSQ